MRNWTDVDALRTAWRPLGATAGVALLLALLSFGASSYRPHFPWVALWLTATLVALVASAAWGWRRGVGEQVALALGLSLFPLGMMLHGLALVGRQATQARIEVRGEYRTFAPGTALSFGRSGSDVPLEFQVPGWGTPEMRITPLVAPAAGGRAYAASVTDSVDFVWEDERLVFGLPLRRRSWIRAGADSAQFRAPGLLRNVLGQGPTLSYRGRILPLIALDRQVVGVDVARGASLGELLGEFRDSLPRALQLTRIHARGRGGSEYHVSHADRRAFRVDGVALPDTFWLRDGAVVRMGVGSEASRFALERRTGPQGVDLLFLRYVRNPGVRRWQLPSNAEPGVPPSWHGRLVLAGGDIPGRFSMLNFSGFPLAPHAPGVLGRLDQSRAGEWSLAVGNGGSLGAMDLLPTPDGKAGFALARRDAPLRLGHFAFLATLLWLSAVLLLVIANLAPAALPGVHGDARPLFAAPSLLFCVVPGLLGILALRTVLAVRAVYLPPHRDAVLASAVLPWLLLPGLAWMVAHWPVPRDGWKHRVRGGASRMGRMQVLALTWLGFGAAACAATAAPGERLRNVALFLFFLLGLTSALWVLSRVLVPGRLARAAEGSPLAPLLRPDTVRVAALRRGPGRSRWQDLREFLQSGTWNAVLLMVLLITPVLVSAGSVLIGRMLLAAAVFVLVAHSVDDRGRTRLPARTAPAVAAVVAFVVTGVLPFTTLRVTARYLLLLGTLLVAMREFAVLRWTGRGRVRAAPGRRARSPWLLPALRWVVPLALALALLLGTVFTDPGIALYVFPVLLGILVLAGATSRAAAGSMVGVLLLGIAAGSFAIPDTTAVAARARPAETGPTPDLHKIAFRLHSIPGPVELRHAATYHPDLLERSLAYARSAEEEIDVRRTVEHWWGMRAYGRQGWLGLGLGGAPMEGRGIPVAVSLSDNAFATLILAEQGALGGAALLLLFVALFALALLSLVNGRPLDAREDHAAILALGTALGLFLLVPALYLAASNAVLVPLTGQNVPFLSLNSSADAFFASAVAALLIALVARSPFSTGTGTGAPAPVDGIARTWSMGISVLAVGMGLFVTIRVVGAAREKAPGDLAYAELQKELRGITEAGILAPGAGDTLEVRGTGPLSELARSDQAFLGRNRMLYNRIRAGADHADTLLALRQPSVFLPAGSGAVRPRPGEIYGVRNPMDEVRALWHGTLASGTRREPAVLLLGDRITVVLTPGAGEANLGPRECRDGGVFRARSVAIRCGAEVYVAWQDSGRVIVEGRRVRLNSGALSRPESAVPGDLLTIPGLGRLVVDAGDTGLLSGARWENGRLVRFSTAEFALARALAWRIDEGVQRGGGATDRNVTLSLDPDLARRLGDGIERYASGTRGRAPAIEAVAVTVMDARTGEVVALAGWSPAGVPRAGDGLCPDSAALDPEARESALALRLNFTAHFPGSAVKPLMAAAAFSRYPSLRTLQVTHPRADHAPRIAGIPAWSPGWPGLDVATERSCVQRLSGGTMVVTPGIFLTCSSNLYAATMAFMASAPPAQGDPSRPAVLPGGRQDYARQVNGQAVSGRPALTGMGRCDGYGCRLLPGHQAPSPLAEEIAELFDVVVSQRQAERSPGGYHDGGLWSSLDSAGMLTTEPYRRNHVSPCATRPYFDLANTTPELARFAVGSQENRWTNIKLAEALARVLTGRRVHATLVRDVGGRRPARAAAIPGDSVWRGPITEGLLRGVDAGTSADLSPFAAAVQRTLAVRGDSVGGIFDLAAKTGTLNDPGSNTHLKVLLMGAGFWTQGRSALELRCGVTVAMHVVFAPTRSGLPDDHLRIARDVVLPTLRDHFGWEDPGRVRRCLAS